VLINAFIISVNSNDARTTILRKCLVCAMIVEEREGQEHLVEIEY